MRTTLFLPKEAFYPGATHAPKWLLVDAEGQILGRLASQVACLLRGKHKPWFAPYLDTGDFVVVINAEKVRLSGKKLRDKYYHRHTGYPGGLKSVQAMHLLEKRPTALVQSAVRRMMPKNALSRGVVHRKLKVYAGGEHPHVAQRPQPYALPYSSALPDPQIEG